MKRVIDVKGLVIGVLATALFFSIIGAKSNDANFNTITAKAIKIVNPEGKLVADLGSFKGEGGSLHIYNKHGNRVATVQANKDSDGTIGLYNRYGDLGWIMTGKK